MPGGSMDIGQAKYLVRVPEDFQDPAEIFSIVAFVRDGKPVYLRDVAFIRDSHKDPRYPKPHQWRQECYARHSKTERRKHRMEVTDQVKAVVGEMKPLLPPNLKIDITSPT